MSSKPIAAHQVLDRLATRRPAPPLSMEQIRAQVRLRWAATMFTALLLPFSLFVALTRHSWGLVVLSAVVAVLALAGLVALGVAWAASRRSAALADWGMRALEPDEMDEFIELADRHEAIGRIMSDTWLLAWAEKGHSLLGRDLVFLRSVVRDYEQVLSRHPEQAHVPYSTPSAQVSSS
jgi:hypothetical protein